VFSFFGSEFGDSDGVYVHCIGVTIFRGGECLIGVGGFDIPLSNFVSAVPLSLEVDGLFVPVVNGGGDGVHGHNVAHEGGGNSCRVVSDEDVFVIDFGHSYIVLEQGGIFGEGWEVLVSSSILPGFLGHSFGREPSNGICFYIMVFKGRFKVGNKHSEGSHGDGGAD